MKVTVCNSSYKKTKSKEKPNRYGFNFSLLIRILFVQLDFNLLVHLQH